MLVKTGFVLLIACLVAIMGLFQAGDLVHILLLVGLMLMVGPLKHATRQLPSAASSRSPLTNEGARSLSHAWSKISGRG